jgi:endonuclease-3
MPTPRRISEPAPELRERAQRIFAILADTYGVPVRREDRDDPLDELIGTILSQHTSDVNSHAAFASLKRRFPTWEAANAAPEGEIATAIRSGGLANVKAARIKRVLATLEQTCGKLDLDWLADLPLEEARSALTGLEGVGPKTAACVLLFSLGLPALPVDTHVHRVAGRLGLIPPKMAAKPAHTFLERLILPEQVFAYHVNLIRHGRRVCKAPVPRCGDCPLVPECDYGRHVVLGDEANES